VGTSSYPDKPGSDATRSHGEGRALVANMAPRRQAAWWPENDARGTLWLRTWLHAGKRRGGRRTIRGGAGSQGRTRGDATPGCGQNPKYEARNTKRIQNPKQRGSKRHPSDLRRIAAKIRMRSLLAWIRRSRSASTAPPSPTAGHSQCWSFRLWSLVLVSDFVLRISCLATGVGLPPASAPLQANEHPPRGGFRSTVKARPPYLHALRRRALRFVWTGTKLISNSNPSPRA
jgi:hypothetical protein